MDISKIFVFANPQGKIDFDWLVTTSFHEGAHIIQNAGMDGKILNIKVEVI